MRLSLRAGPEGHIARLDASLARRGQSLKLSRPGGSPLDHICRASVRDFQIEELVGSVVQGDRKAILSPTGLASVGWAYPQQGDRALVDGAWYRIEAAPRKSIADVVVRIELQLRGG